MSKNSKTFTFGDNYGNECVVVAKRGQIRLANRIMKAANNEGTIQAGEARELFGDPRHHTTMSLATAFGFAGFEVNRE